MTIAKNRITWSNFTIDFDLRKKCIEGMINKPANGFAIGGLSGGENKLDFIKIVNFCCEKLPKNKPRFFLPVLHMPIHNRPG